MWTRFPTPLEPHTEEYIVQWIAAQLQRKQQGMTHDVATVAIYEEHAR